MPRFVPCRTSHLANELALLLPQDERGAFWELVRGVENLFHHYASVEGRLCEELYAPFDPDVETVPAVSPVKPDPLDRLVERLGRLFERANFDEAPREALLTSTDRDVLAKLKIDPELDALEHVSVFHRGRGTKAVLLRPVRRLLRLEEHEVPTYRRVAVVVRTRREPYVLIKLFKDVPCRDLELLLPTVRVKMKLMDKLKLSGSGGAAAVSAWKLLRALYLHAPVLAKALALPFQALILPIGVLITGVYGGKTLLDYTKIRASYITALAEHLYAITMASNQSAIARLADMGGEEDTKELLLAWAMLQRTPRVTSGDLAQACERFVWDRYRAAVRFDVVDAVQKLTELALCVREPDGRLSAVSLGAALRSVDHAWDEVYSPPARDRDTRRMRAVQDPAP